MIKVGDKLPEHDFIYLDEDDPENYEYYSIDYMFSKQKNILFGVPGAFTDICTKQHVPSFISNAPSFFKRSIDEIYCLIPNHYWVANAWMKEFNTSNVKFIPDGNGDYIEKLGIENDLRDAMLGITLTRFSMYVVDGFVKQFYLERPTKDNRDPYKVSDGNTMVKYIKSRWEYNG